MVGAESGLRSRPVNDDGTEVGDVGECRARDEKVADAVEKPRGIVVGEKRGGIEAGGPGATKRRRVDEGPGRVVGAAATAVGSVGIRGQRRYAGGAVEVDGERQSVFLVGPAAAVAAQRDRELAAGKDDHPAALGA